MLPELTGLPLEEAERQLTAAGIAYTTVFTQTPFRHPEDQRKQYLNYAVRFVQGELTYASFPITSFKHTEDMNEI